MLTWQVAMLPDPKRTRWPRCLLAAGLLILLLGGCEASTASDGGVDSAADAAADRADGVRERGPELASCAPAGWTVLQTGVSADLFGVWGERPQQLVAVGSEGTLLHFDDTRWRSASAVPGAVRQVTWRAVWGASEQAVFAAGDWGEIAHFNGLSWRREAAPVAAQNTDLLAAGGLAGGAVFIAGSHSTLLRRASSGWLALAAPSDATLQLAGLAAVGQQLWAVGGGLIPATVAALRYQGERWQQVGGLPPASGQLGGIWGDDQGRALAVGRGGPNALPPLLRLEGGLWTSDSAAAGVALADELTAVWGASWERVLVTGGGLNSGGLVLRFDGRRWERLELPAEVPRLNALWGWPSGEVMLVGDRGVALRYCDPPAPALPGG